MRITATKNQIIVDGRSCHRKNTLINIILVGIMYLWRS